MTQKVYFLKSLKDNVYYIGCTSVSLNDRLFKHNAGHVRSTKPRRPWKLIYFEEFTDRSAAYKREYYLKRPSGYQEKLRIIQSCNKES
ncbi:MAG: GIY-YIG nuclease family protein [Candidatus Falkowbacteria bacterium]